MVIRDIIQKVDELTLSEICNADFISIIKSDKAILSSSDRRLLSKHISDFRRLGSEITLKRILIYSIWCPDEAIEVSRKKGVFRYKAWGLGKNHAEFILQSLKSQCQIMRYSQETCHFIDTKLQLSWIFSFYKQTEKEIIEYIMNHHKKRKRIKVDSTIVEEALFKELLAYADAIFFFHKRKFTKDHLNKNQLNGYGEEEIADSISYLIYLYDDVIGIKDHCHYIAIPGYVSSDEIEKIILLGCKIHQLQEWEVCIDYFDYRVKDVDNKCIIYDKSEIFEKSIRLGFVRKDMQEDLFYMNNRKNSEEKIVKFTNICKYIKDKLGSTLISSVGSGELSRFRFEFPEPLFDPFKPDGEFAKKLFEEDLLAIGYCAKELIMTIDDALEKRITENCTLYDVIMFQRFFTLLNLVAAEILFEQKDKMKVIRSLIPSFQKETIEKTLSIFIGDQVKTKELIQLFTYRKDIKLDLQYTPLLEVSGGLVFSVSLASKSNLLRNCIANSYLLKNQIVNIDELEPLVLECAKIFSQLHPEYQIFTNKRFSYLQQSGEIDVLIISETDIIIIECKCPLSPTNNFEMRASVDHLRKAAKQLSHSKLAMSDISFRKNFLKNIKVDDTPRNIYTCVVFGNRLFNGYTIDSHPIRYIRELDMILNNGHIYSEAGIWRVWENEQYAHSDLIKFISPTYVLGTSNFNAMEKVEQFIYIKGRKVILETYAFNIVKAFNQYDKVFSIERKNDEFRTYLKKYEES